MRHSKETIMNTRENSDALIDLGAASVETQGFIPVAVDLQGIGLPNGMSSDD
jgi:hypothetical protein